MGHYRFESFAQRLEQGCTGGRRPARFLGGKNGSHPLGIFGDVARFPSCEDPLDIGIGHRMGQRDQLGALKIGNRARDHQQAAGVPVQSHLLQEHHLVGKDVARVAAVVVEEAQLVVEEAGRARRRDHPGCVDVGDVLPAAVHAPLALLDGEGLLGAVWHVVDHRVPDGTGVLRHMHIDMAEFGQHVQSEWARVVHVEDGRDAIGDDDAGVADRAVGRCAQRDDHHVQIALGPAHPMLDGVLGLEEPVEAELLQFPPQIGNGEVGQQHHCVLADVIGEQFRVEVVEVQVRDI